MTLDEAWAALEAAVARFNKGREIHVNYGLTRQISLHGKLRGYRAFIGDGEAGAGYGDTAVEAIQGALNSLEQVLKSGKR